MSTTKIFIEIDPFYPNMLGEEDASRIATEHLADWLEEKNIQASVGKLRHMHKPTSGKRDADGIIEIRHGIEVVISDKDLFRLKIVSPNYLKDLRISTEDELKNAVDDMLTDNADPL